MPRRSASKYTVTNLMRLTDSGRKSRSKYINTGLIDIKLILRGRDKPIAYLRFVFEVKGRSDRYITRIEVPLRLSDQKSFLNLPAKVYCSCPDFKYRWAYALKKANALIYSPKLGIATKEPPVKTNPQLASGLCKHLLASARRLSRISKKKVLLYLQGKITINEL